MSFYRIYRPQTIGEIDSAFVRERLMTLLQKDRKLLPHAYLLYGPKGSGKTTAARIIAKIFSCEKPAKDGPCGKCETCKSISDGTWLGVLEMDAASNRGIEDIRVLRERIGLAPVRGKYTIYIIDEVHMLTAEAFNALLKTLEEPPGHAVFVLATTDPQKVPATIRSRCVEIPFRKAGDEEIAHAIGRIVKKEKMNIKSDAIAAIIDAADGAFRDAVKMLEQASFIKGEITKERIRTMLSISDEVRRAKFLHTLFTKKDPGVCIAEIQSLSQAGIDAKQFLTDCISDLEETLVRKVKGTENSDERMWVDVDVRDFSRRLIEAYGLLKICPVSELPIELAVIDFCQGRSIQPTSDTKKAPAQPSSGLLTLEKLTSHWPDFIDELKSHNHSVAGVLRSAKPKSVEHGVVTIEAFYKFHQERLSEARVRDILSEVLKKLFGEKVKVEIVLGKK